MEKPNSQEVDLDALKETARDLRLDILEMTTKAGSGHPSSSFSAVELLTALYFGNQLRFRPDDPWWPKRDRFIMSKGHAAPLLYAVLARAGYFDHQLLCPLERTRRQHLPEPDYPWTDRAPACGTGWGCHLAALRNLQILQDDGIEGVSVIKAPKRLE